MLPRCLTYLLLILLPLAAASAQTVASAALDSNFAETGTPFTLHLTIPKTAGSQPTGIDFSNWQHILPAENRLAQSPWTDQGDHYTADLTLIAFDADTLRLPPLAIRLQGGGQALTPPLEVAVLPTPSPDELTDMADIEDIRVEPTHWTDHWPWALAGLGVLAALALLFWRAAHLGHKPAAVSSRSVKMPPHSYALRRLEALTEKRLWQQGAVKAYYAELTHILRQYLQQHYDIPALESTSHALLNRLSHTTDFPATLQEPLRELLTQADLAKFAKGMPPASFHHQAWQTVRLIVTATSEEKPAESESVAKPG